MHIKASGSKGTLPVSPRKGTIDPSEKGESLYAISPLMTTHSCIFYCFHNPLLHFTLYVSKFYHIKS